MIQAGGSGMPYLLKASELYRIHPPRRPRSPHRTFGEQRAESNTIRALPTREVGHMALKDERHRESEIPKHTPAVKRAGNDDDYEITGGSSDCNHDFWHYNHADRCKNCNAVRTKKNR